MIDHPKMTVTAPIKINLSLEITGRREDQYHLLQSLIVFVSDGDQLQLRPSSQDIFVIEGIYSAELQTEKSANLICKSRDLLRCYAQKHGFWAEPVALYLQKKLPIASGLGGGSADAAATLFLLNKFWGLNYNFLQLQDIAKSLGADVPMCLYYLMHQNPIVWATNIGDILEVVSKFPSLAILLINPHQALSTEMVFKTYTQLRDEFTPKIEFAELPQETNWQAWAYFLQNHGNDLYDSAQQQIPEIEVILQQLQEQKTLFANMSGSGASCFGLFSDLSQAKQAATQIQKNYPNWFYLAANIDC